MNYTLLLILHVLILIYVFALDQCESVPKWFKSFLMAFTVSLISFILFNTLYLMYKYSWVFSKEFRDNLVNFINPENMKMFSKDFSVDNVKSMVNNPNLQNTLNQSKGQLQGLAAQGQQYLNSMGVQLGK